MAALLSAFLLGCICGLRSMTAAAVVAWGAHLGWLHLEGSLFAFFANKISLVIFYFLFIESQVLLFGSLRRVMEEMSAAPLALPGQGHSNPALPGWADV